MSLKEAFDQAAKDVKDKLTSRPTNDELLEIYALFKQATVGDNNTSRPGMLSMDLKGKAKWDAWTAKKGTSSEEAMTRYVALVKELVAKYSGSS